MAIFDSPLKIVLDTNVILSSLSKRSPYRIIIDKLMDVKYEIFVTTEILLEYDEKISTFFDPLTAQLFLDSFEVLPNVHYANVYYKFLLITHDADDDKFADCAIASGVHFLVTDDKHFKVLLKKGFPRVTLMKIKDFAELLEKS